MSLTFWIKRKLNVARKLVVSIRDNKHDFRFILFTLMNSKYTISTANYIARKILGGKREETERTETGSNFHGRISIFTHPEERFVGKGKLIK